MSKRKKKDTPRGDAVPVVTGGLLAPPDARPLHRRIAADLGALVADLPPAAARDALAALLPQSRDTRRRALRAALIQSIRLAGMAAPAAEPAPPPPPPEPPEPPKAPGAAPPPKAGALTSLALEDAARLLFAAGGDDEEDGDDTATPDPLPEGDAQDAPDTAAPPQADEPAAEPAFQPRDLATDVQAEAAEDVPAPAPKPKRRKSKATDPADAGALLAATGLPDIPAKPVAFDLSAQFAALGADEAEETPAKPAAFDLSSQFAAMGEIEADEAPAGPAVFRPVDLVAFDAVALPEPDGDAVSAATGDPDPTEAVTEAVPEKPKRRAPRTTDPADVAALLSSAMLDDPPPAKPAPFDLSAQFAALDDPSED
jgi:hypothetical protein